LQSYTKSQKELSNYNIDDGWCIHPQIKFVNCPIKTSLGVLGKKWTPLIIRDIGFLKIGHFNQILKSISGITPRVLSMRLKELEKEGIIECIKEDGPPMSVLWMLTDKGKDVLPILTLLTAFGSKWYSETVFEDKKPRKLTEIYPTINIKKIIRDYL
jgi:DNA-binding HxlR family transcriptional regulator